MNVFTLEQLTKEFERLGLSKNDEGLTSAELAKRWGISKTRTLARLRQAAELGWLELGERKTKRVDGKDNTSTVYRIVLPAKTKRSKP